MRAGVARRRVRLGCLGAATRTFTGSPATSRRTSSGVSFNLGIGYCAVVPEAAAGELPIGRIVANGVIGVLVSGEGTDLQALLDAGLPVVAVASRPGRGHAALARADAAGVDAAAFPLEEFDDRPARDAAMADWIAGARSPLGGLSPGTCTCSRPRSSTASRAVRQLRTPRRCRAFPGAHPIEDVLAAGVAESGCDRPLRRRGDRTRRRDRRPSPCRCSPRRHRGDAARARPGRRARAAAARRPGADRRVQAFLLRLRQDRARRVRERPGRARLRAGHERRHGCASSRTRG